MKIWDWLIRRRLPTPPPGPAPRPLTIKGHLLDGRGVHYQPSPNRGDRFIIEPHFIVIHFTGGSAFQSTVNFLCEPETQASAHVVIARDGRITQLVPFHTVAWHADPSSWRGYCMLNPHSIGIELDNPGELHMDAGRPTAWYGRSIARRDAVHLAHQHSPSASWWHTYTTEQIAQTEALCRLLMDLYPIDDILGHDDIAPQRKRDPGPAFPMAELRARLGFPSRRVIA